MQWLKRKGGHADRARSTAALANAESGNGMPAACEGSPADVGAAMRARAGALTDTAHPPSVATTKRRPRSGTGGVLPEAVLTATSWSRFGRPSHANMAKHHSLFAEQKKDGGLAGSPLLRPG